MAVVAIADVDEILRECATPAASSIARRWANPHCAQLATEIEAGAQVSWRRTAPDRVDTVA